MLAPTLACAAQSVTLPAWVCAQPDAIFVSEFDGAETPVLHDPTLGSGGITGSTTRHVHVAGLGNGTQRYYVHVPTKYDASHPIPLVLALHGTAPYNGQNGYAADVRDTWANVSEVGQFIVAAPIADDAIDTNGDGSPDAVSWLVPPTSGPNDYDLFNAVLADLAGAYNIDRMRLYGWGFSSGGHVMHALGLTSADVAFNNSSMAAYTSAAGALAGDLCAGKSDAQCDLLVEAAPRKIPVSIVVGTSDSPTYGSAMSDYNRFSADGWTSGANVFFDTFSGGHTYSQADLQLAWNRLCPNAVTP